MQLRTRRIWLEAVNLCEASGVMIDQGGVMRRYLLLGLMLMVLSACQAPAPIGLTATSITVGPSETVKPSPTVLPTDTPTPLPTATPMFVRPVSTDQLTAWTFYDPRDPTRQDLIVKDGDSYRLDPTWKVKAIHYFDSVQTMLVQDYTSQVIVRQGDHYESGTKVIPAEKVQAVIDSLRNLHPSQRVISVDAPWTTDGVYKSWLLELLGEDGRHVEVQLISGEDARSPWTVIDNGRIYSQYDHQLNKALADLVDEGLWIYIPAANWAKVTLPLGTNGIPGDLLYGFDGLWPISFGFRYQVDAESQRIVGGVVNEAIGTKLRALQRVELTLPDQSVIQCLIDPRQFGNWLPGELPVGTFACPVSGVTPTQAYRFPIRIEALTHEGKSLISDGILRGFWDEDVLVQLPLDPDLVQAIDAQPAAADLLRDHIIYGASYLAATNPITSSNRTVAGRMVLLSQIEWNGQPVRYTVGAPFVLQEGQLARWDLTREALDQLLQDVLRLPLTQRVLSAAPDTVLNLGYAEDGLHPIISEHGFDRMGEPFQLAACGQVISQTLPRPDVPLRTFALSQGFSFFPNDFIMVDAQPAAYWLSLDPTQGALFSLLLPTPLHSEPSVALDEVYVSGDFPYGPELNVSLPYSVTNPLEPLQAIAATLPVTAELDSEAGSLSAHGVTVGFTADGRLEIVKCQP